MRTEALLSLIMYFVDVSIVCTFVYFILIVRKPNVECEKGLLNNIETFIIAKNQQK